MRIVKKFFVVSVFLCLACEEYEQTILLKTVLESASDTEIVVRGELLDIPDNSILVAYGVCWSDNGEPDINGSKYRVATTVSDPVPFNFSSTLKDFLSNKTYYFRSFIELANGEIRYGNTIDVLSQYTRGKWRKLADHWYPPTLTQITDEECGPATEHVSVHSLFVNAAFAQNKPVTYGGFQMIVQGRSYVETGCQTPADGYPAAWGYNLWRNQKMRRLEHNNGVGEWVQKTSVPFIYGSEYESVGGIGIMDKSIFYLAGGTKICDQSYSHPLFGLYELASYVEGNLFSDKFYAIDAESGFMTDLPPVPLAKVFGVSFLLENKIYIIGGICYEDGHQVKCSRDLVYDIGAGEWSMMDPFPGETVWHGVGFVINGKAYVGSGFSSWKEYDLDWGGGPAMAELPVKPTNQFWEFDPSTQSWKRIADFPGVARGGAFSFALDGFGYMGCGAQDLFTKYLKDFWRYDPSKDKWTQLDDFPGGRRFGATGFANTSIGAAGFGLVIREDNPAAIEDYLVDPETGDPEWLNVFNTAPNVDLWTYDPSSN
jgi:hypothetical protein